MKSEFNRKYWEFFEQNKDKRFLILVGGAGAGKSHSIAQYLIRKFYKEKNKVFLVIRKTLPSLKITAYKLILELLKNHNLVYQLNKSDLRMNVNDNEMIFKGLDDPEKVKSFEPNYIWMEEANEFTKEDFTQLNLRLRRHTNETNQIYLSFNPVSKLSWVYERFFESSGVSNIAILKTNYRDNRRYLSQEYVDELEKLKEQDMNYYKIYALGEFGVLKNVIYTNYDIIKGKDWPESFDETIYGLDFGFNNPSSLLEIGIKDTEYYERERLYKTGLTNADLIAELEELVKNKDDNIYADSAEPARIEEIQRAGFNVYPSNKEVKDGIDFVKRHRVHIHEDSVNHIDEKRGYKYKEDKNGNVLEEPVKFRDHLQDCERYALYTHSSEVPLDFWVVDTKTSS